ncbi:alkaline shock response membrane anchor protein AmaP [Streptococcus halichoeri]|uniref:alkaline shock response membrane anchor protein AmaP n=1 Tax=Streptococcus halichoeri TaxID=254785 RepID=UPI001357E9F8|nr:alkaline shock response membrane anchor protein AmaP [Streptococcus halichoeri]
MAKSLKIIFSLISLVLLSILLLVITATAGYVNLPASYDWLSWDTNQVPYYLNPGLYYYFFWAAVVLAIVVVIGLLVVIFYPRTYTEIKLAKDNGTLMLKKTAIEGYVRSAVQETGLMKRPNVNISMYKHKFKVDVAGQLASRVGAAEQISGLKKGIETGLSQFLGLNRPVNFTVRVKDIQSTDLRTVDHDRVE